MDYFYIYMAIESSTTNIVESRIPKKKIIVHQQKLFLIILKNVKNF